MSTLCISFLAGEVFYVFCSNIWYYMLTVSMLYACRKVEKSMNVLATKLSKPQLNYVDRLEIALGMFPYMVLHTLSVYKI